ncbi:MAG: metallophosphoesterase [Bacilli bacterium]
MNTQLTTPDEIFALLGDLHLGVKADDPWMEKNILETLTRFCDECKEKNIKYCIQTGDFFDVRNRIAQRTIQFVREKIVPLFQETFERTFAIVGNHDLQLKDKITPNSCREILGQYDSFTIIEKPTKITLEGVTIDLIPWICKENSTDVFEFIKASTSRYCVGHFELNGYEFYKGVKSSGLEPDFLEKYDAVWSGHFHTISSGGNVEFVGTPYTITLGDANDPRGYWLYDKVSASINFYENPVMNHRRVYFDADTWTMTEAEIVSEFKDKVVHLVIERSLSETNKVNLDKVLTWFESTCYEFTSKEMVGVSSDDDSDIDVKVMKTIEVIHSQVDLLDENDSVKNRVKTIFNGLYAEAGV